MAEEILMKWKQHSAETSVKDTNSDSTEGAEAEDLQFRPGCTTQTLRWVQCDFPTAVPSINPAASRGSGILCPSHALARTQMLHTTQRQRLQHGL